MGVSRFMVGQAGAIGPSRPGVMARIRPVAAIACLIFAGLTLPAWGAFLAWLLYRALLWMVG